MTSAARTEPQARSLTYAGLFTVTLASLMFETGLTRIFSVTMWYHFAFVAISIALFGNTAGALIVHFRPQWFTDDKVKSQLWRFSLLFGVTLALCFLTLLTVPFVPEGTGVGIWSSVVTCTLVAIPFTCLGVVITLALTRFPGRVNRLYTADLVGAGIGCIGLVVLFQWFDGPSLVLLTGALACAGAFLFALDDQHRRGKVLALVATAVLVVVSFGNATLARDQRAFIRVQWTKEQKDERHMFERWNAFSRITADGNRDLLAPPNGNGLSPKTPQDLPPIKQLGILIDSTAGTAAIGAQPDVADADRFLRYDISNLAYHAKRNAKRVAVVGVGGGRDVKSALEFGAKHVDGIEINGVMLNLINDTLGDFVGHLDRNPRVSLHNDEARSFLTRSHHRYDVLQISLIDTWAATQAGAFALSENSLYTTDAWDTFLDRLQPDGILTVSRWYQMGIEEPLETYRTISLAAQTLTDRGVKNPRDHILVFHGPPVGVANVATILVSPEPFSASTRDALIKKADQLDFDPVLTPTRAADPRLPGLVRPGGPTGFDRFKADVSPPTDDKPFFFQMVDFKQVLKGEGIKSKSHIYRAVYTLSLLAVTVMLLAAACILLPLLFDARRAKARGRTLPRGLRPFYLFFAAIGLAFLLVEISQLQRLGVFLGHPTYALTVVLFTVLTFSGIGSSLTERFVRPERPASVYAPFGILLVLLAGFLFVEPRLTEHFAGSTTPIRIAVSMALLAPLALVMGMPFPIGMSLATETRDAPVAYFWGINGAMSVVASVLAAAIALFFGLNASFLAGLFAYLLAGVAIVLILRGRGGRDLVDHDPDGDVDDDCGIGRRPRDDEELFAGDHEVVGQDGDGIPAEPAGT